LGGTPIVSTLTKAAEPGITNAMATMSNIAVFKKFHLSFPRIVLPPSKYKTII